MKKNRSERTRRRKRDIAPIIRPTLAAKPTEKAAESLNRDTLRYLVYREGGHAMCL